MANTYTQFYVQYVFAVQNRISLIHHSWEEELYKIITGIVQNHKHKMIAINGMPDHLHVFIGQHPTQSPSDLMKIVKGESSSKIKDKGWVPERFRWQGGFGAFTYSKRDINRVYRYIMNQKEHHKKQNFIDEYKSFLDGYGIEYDPKYIFKPVVGC